MQYDVLNVIREKLERNNWDLNIRLFAAKEYYEGPQTIMQKVAESINSIPGTLKSLCALFLLGQSVDLCELDGLFSNDEIRMLVNAKFLRISKNIVRSNFLIFPFLGCYVAVDCNFRNSKDVYLGEDSYLLAQLLQTLESNNVLDLCTGIGMQAIISGKKAKKCIAIDINKHALSRACINVNLNKLGHKVHLIRGDLFGPLSKDDRFDLICANPPLIPVPSSLHYPLYGNGGPDGLSIVTRILNRLDEYLENKGKAILLCSSMRLLSGINLVKELENKFKQMRWDVTLFISDANPTEIEAERLSSIINKLYGHDRKRVYRKYMDHFKALGADHIFYCILLVVKDLDHKFQMKVIESPRAIIYKRPYLQKMVKICEKFNVSYHVAINNELFELDRDSYMTLKECDGRKNVIDIAKLLSMQTNNSLVESYLQVIELLRSKELKELVTWI